jgi:hypothetical protein
MANGYIPPMKGVVEIERALRQLPRQEQWQIVCWLLDVLESNGQGGASKTPTDSSVPVRDYAARRRRVFGDKVLPNMVLAARETER